ncbi:GNAT family N-acetyltransferase [Patescibacteria group bacterium]|nr:GNAT family N-acetyltransferase [Patescibacteria group bacterium]
MTLNLMKLDWDSEFFGHTIAELSGSVSRSGLEAVLNEAKKSSIELIQACVDLSDVDQINMLEENGFLFWETKVTYEKKLSLEKKEKPQYIEAQENNVPALQNIASQVFVDSKYYAVGFDKKKVDTLYEVWVEKAVKGTFDDFCLIHQDEDDILGFITAKILDKKTARIGLIGVDPRHQSKGTGTQLLLSLDAKLAEEGIEKIQVSTQGKNVVANNFYIKNSFYLKESHVWLYKKII